MRFSICFAAMACWFAKEEPGHLQPILFIGCTSIPRQPPAKANGLIHHSDRGIQYCGSKYVSCLQKHNIDISMTKNGDPYENAIAERVNGILKTKWLYDMTLKDCAEANIAIKEIIAVYNNLRTHSSIEMLTPNQAHQMTGTLKRLWKTYYRKRQNEILVES